MKPNARALLPLLLTLGLAGAPSLLGQWESWRGPEGSGVSRETALPSTVDGQILWRQPIIGGRSTPVVVDGRVVISTRGGQGVREHEKLICYDAETGKVRWEDPINVFHTTIPGPRVGWANPTADPETGYVYFHGVEGLLKCYDRDGKEVWSRSLTEEFGRISGYGGRTNTPVIDEGLVILSFLNSSWGEHGRGAHRFVAFDKLTGEVIWWSSPGGTPLDTTYSTPVVAVINGVRQLVCGCADGSVYGLKARTGEKIWGYPMSKRGINVSPVVVGTRVFIAHGEESLDTTTMGRAVCLDAARVGDDGKPAEVWRVDGLTVGYASPAVYGGRVYVVDNSANLYALDAGNGQKLWEYSIGKVGKGSPVVADGKIYVTEFNGRFLILEPGERECKLLGAIDFTGSDGSESETFSSPAVAGGRVYLTTRDEVICIGAREWKGRAGKVPGLAAEKRDVESTPVTLLLTPADIRLTPGEAVRFRARLYNAAGQFLEDARVTNAVWMARGLNGILDSSGELAIPVVSGLQSGKVEVAIGDLSAAARVRVVSGLPLAIDFNEVEPDALPPGWVGLTPIRFKIAEVDGDRVLMKHGTHQRFTRALAFVGPPSMKDYTIQADLRGTFRRRTLPDMGLINQRYRLALIGVDEQLRVLTWVPQKRLEKNVPFQWKQDVWYRMKFRVSPRGDRALIQGKVWPRNESEPEQWTVEVEDPFPHVQGSPGIYAYTAGTTARSRGTDVYFDNIEITSND